MLSAGKMLLTHADKNDIYLNDMLSGRKEEWCININR